MKHKACFGASLLLLLSCGLQHPLHGAQPTSVTADIVVDRKWFSKDCTSGYVSVNGRTLAYTLEPPWVENEEYFSSVPPGLYQGIIRQSLKGTVDAWRVELVNMKDRSNVQFHIGNFPANTEGCILLGHTIDPQSLCVVGQSKTAYLDFMRAVYRQPTASEFSAVDEAQIQVRIIGILPETSPQIIVHPFPNTVRPRTAVDVPVTLRLVRPHISVLPLPSRLLECYAKEETLGSPHPVTTIQTDADGNAVFHYVTPPAPINSKGREMPRAVSLFVLFRGDNIYGPARQNNRIAITVMPQH